MQKVKTYLIGILALFLLISIWQLNSFVDKYKAEKEAKERWQLNYMEQTKEARENKNIVLTQREFLSLKDRRISRLLDSLNIKPKIVVKYEEKTIIQKETDTVLVPVEKIATGTYKFNDSGPCFSYSGIATILGSDSLRIERNQFVYKNTVADLFYRRQKGKFIFWKTYYRNKIDRVSVPECGEASTTTIEVLKK